MRLCHVVASLETQYGGPSKSVYNLSEALSKQGHIVSLFATHPSTASIRRERDLTIEVFRRGFPGFLCPSAGLKAKLAYTDANTVHAHGLWLRTLAYSKAAAIERRIPLVISPRGMMGPWAWKHHRTRKKLSSWFVHPGAFESAGGWHATSDAEANEIRALGFQQPICVAPNGVSAPDPEFVASSTSAWHELVPEARTRPVALFYSRFHDKKRVRELIKLWSLRKKDDWLLLVVGIPEQFSEFELAEYAKSVGAEDSIRVLSGEKRPPPYGIASLFVLPSHNENFGLSVAEAMTFAVPVLVTDGTPWSAVNNSQIGWCVPWPEFGNVLESALSVGASALSEKGVKAKAWIETEFSWARAASLLGKFYQTLSA